MIKENQKKIKKPTLKRLNYKKILNLKKKKTKTNSYFIINLIFFNDCSKVFYGLRDFIFPIL